MRKFTDKENQLLKRFVELKQKGELQHLQVSYQLRTNLEFFALKWETVPTPKVSVYVPKGEKKDKAVIEQQYFKIADFIYFIEELCDNGFLRIQTLPSNDSKTECILFDRDKYTFDEDKDNFVHKEIDKNNSLILELFGDSKLSVIDKVGGAEGINGLSKSILPNSFANNLQKIALGLIYPLPLAEDYVANGFKLLEELQFDEQMKNAAVQIDKANESLSKSVTAIKIALWSLVISIATFLVSVVFNIYQCFSQQELDDKQFNLLREDIKSTRIITPVQTEIVSPVKVDIQTPIKTELRDTINVKNTK
jgi:hypothetical protein